MHGSGNTPPVRSDGVVITMRVLFALCSVFSCGILACVPLFRIAILRGRWFDWAAAWVSLPVVITALAVVGELPAENVSTDIAMICILLVGAGSAAYFLVFDIRYYARIAATGRGAAPPHVPYGPYAQAPQAPQPPYAPQAAPPQYGYPNPYAGAPVANPAPAPVPMPQQPQPQQQPQQPPQQHPHPHPHRMDQVRAELDELSDLLRNDRSDRDGRDGRNDRNDRNDRKDQRGDQDR